MAKKPQHSNKINTPCPPTTINSLPAEVLGHIFQFVLPLHTQPSFLEREKYSEYPNYPETLLQVCSRWRQIALASPTLWSRIDIVLSHPNGQRLLERAEIFLQRAGQSPLDIRIFDKVIRSWKSSFARSRDEFSKEECDDFPDSDEDAEGSGISGSTRSVDVCDFFTSFPTHASVRSIEFVIASPRAIGSFYAPVFHRCFEYCLAGKLTKLVLRAEASGGMHFVLPSTKESEVVWLPITTLHSIGGIRPPWESNAFKGLTDLRLGHGASGSKSISESQFVKLLRSNPKLRIFQLHLKLVSLLAPNIPVEPIQLDDLEVLDIIENHLTGSRFETLTRWIAMGQKPLRLSLWCALGSSEVKSFFQRSNVAELHVRLHGTSAGALETLIDLSPRLRMLAVDGCGGRFNPNSTPADSGSSQHPTQIDALHLQYCDTQMSLLKQMLQRRSVHTLTMWSTRLHEGYYGVTKEEIQALCSNAKVLRRREFTSMDHWIKSIV